MITFMLTLWLFNANNQPLWSMQRNHQYVSYEDCASNARHWVTQWEARSGLKGSWSCDSQPKPTAEGPDQK